MIFRRKKEKGGRPVPATFDLLRARVESTVGRPGVIVVTSAVHGDGKSSVCNGLAASLGSTGYRTLLVDANVRRDAIIRSATKASIEEALLQSVCESVIPRLRIATLTNPAFHREASLPSVAQALAEARTSYEYIVVDAGCALRSALAGHFVSSADAVLVAVRAGRRRLAEDIHLSESLDRLDAQFFGVVAIGSSIIGSASALIKLPASEVAHEVYTGRLDRGTYARNARPRIEL